MPELEIIELYHQEIVLEFEGELGVVFALVQALPAAGSGGGGAAWTELEVNLGYPALAFALVTVNDPAVTLTSAIAVVRSGRKPTSKGSDENEMELAILSARAVAAGQFRLSVVAHTGKIGGSFRIAYQVIN